MSDAVVAPVEDAAAPVATPPAEPQPDLASQFAEIQRREKALRVGQNKLKQELAAERARVLEEIKSNPVAKLRDLGISTADLALQALDIPEEKLTPEQELRKEVEELKAHRAAQEALAKSAEDSRLLAAFERDVFAVVEKDQDRYEVINHYPGGKDLYKASVVKYCAEYGEMPDLADIANRVEAELESRITSMSKLKRFSKKEKEAATADIVADVKKDAEPKKRQTTLSTSLTAHSTPKSKLVSTKTDGVLTTTVRAGSDAERRARLAATYAKLTKG